MGTNFYLFSEPSRRPTPCVTCGHVPEWRDDRTRLHIGKSSVGWAFLLHTIPSERLNELSDWDERWSAPGAVIEDEYGRVVSPEEMRRWITERSHPKGLSRHGHGAGPGLGTYDLYAGEFS